MSPCCLNLSSCCCCRCTIFYNTAFLTSRRPCHAVPAVAAVTHLRNMLVTSPSMQAHPSQSQTLRMCIWCVHSIALYPPIRSVAECLQCHSVYLAYRNAEIEAQIAHLRAELLHKEQENDRVQLQLTQEKEERERAQRKVRYVLVANCHYQQPCLQLLL